MLVYDQKHSSHVHTLYTPYTTHTPLTHHIHPLHSGSHKSFHTVSPTLNEFMSLALHFKPAIGIATASNPGRGIPFPALHRQFPPSAPSSTIPRSTASRQVLCLVSDIKLICCLQLWLLSVHSPSAPFLPLYTSPA